MSDRRTLLPELLPGPQTRDAEGPRARVETRARAMLDRLAGIKTVAGAAVLAAHCGGYGVVDPLPTPAACTAAPNSFASLGAESSPIPSDGAVPNVRIWLYDYYSAGYRLDAVRVTQGGTLVGVQDKSSTAQGVGTSIFITLQPDGSGSSIDFEVDLSCGGPTFTQRYSASPGGDSVVPVSADAGAGG